MQDIRTRRNKTRSEQLRLLRAVEQLRTIDHYLEMAMGLISHLSGFYFDAWRDTTAASAKIKHALFVLDDSGESEHIMEKRWGV